MRAPRPADAGNAGNAADAADAADAGKPSVDDEVLLARAYLCRVAERACVGLWALVAEVGPVEAAARVRAQDGLDERVIGATRARHARVDPEADLLATERFGLRMVVPESDDWPSFAMTALEYAGAERARTYEQDPQRFADSGEPVPPLALWAAGPGDLRTLGIRSAGVVGARTSSSYGNHIARTMARGLAERDVTVVSGGAYGIDRYAHEGTLEAGGVTVLISAAGLDRTYPSTHARLYRAVRESGLLLSESPPGTAPHRHRFLNRNRLIGCLSTGTVVVEAATRSGALNTARHCVELGRPLMAVPGPVGSATSAGCHLILRNEHWNATLVTNADEVLEVMGTSTDLGDIGRSPGEPAAPPPPIDRIRRALDRFDPQTRRVFDAVPAGRAVDVDELVSVCGLSVSEVLAALPGLELVGLIDHDEAGYRLRR